MNYIWNGWRSAGYNTYDWRKLLASADLRMKVRDQTPSTTSLKGSTCGEGSYESRDVNEARGIPRAFCLSLTKI